ncbi:unnamed protein product [Allacma fusca]|uniref:Uncharacterized protein n=1 Tax=Allacma fusca TaxID=39272 RepID=A0A8J2PCI6_9HEXA|nr:unnamed protein product [Allacma fusca]
MTNSASADSVGFGDVMSAIVAKYPELLGSVMAGSWSVDDALEFFLGLVSQLGPTAVLALVFIIGVGLGLAILVFVRVAYFYPFENPSKPGIFGDFFNEEFGNADFFRRVLEAVEDTP